MKTNNKKIIVIDQDEIFGFTFLKLNINKLDFPKDGRYYLIDGKKYKPLMVYDVEDVIAFKCEGVNFIGKEVELVN